MDYASVGLYYCPHRQLFGIYWAFYPATNSATVNITKFHIFLQFSIKGTSNKTP
jgi:hypothetical protein